MDIKFYNNKVFGKQGISRENEPVTITGWYPNEHPKQDDSGNVANDRARVFEYLTHHEVKNEVPRADGKVPYVPAVVLEISTQAKPEEKATVTRVNLSNDFRDTLSRDLKVMFSRAFEEFDACRGWVNVNGQKKALETKYFKEAGININGTPVQGEGHVSNNRKS